MRRLCASVLSILLALGWLTSPATIGAAQAAPAKPSVSPGHPVRGVAFTVAGKLTTKVARPVQLQRKSGSKWVKIASGTTTSSGRYSFSASSSVSTAQLRVYAPKTKIGKKTYPKLTSKVNTVRTVAVTPSSPMAGETFTVVESLGKKGARPASLQRQSGKSWITLQTVKTSAAGTATFSASLDASASLRVYAPKTKIKKKTYSKITVATFRVAISAQSGTLSLPSTGITGQALVAETQFTPARAGRTVELQQLSGGSWVTIATSAQDATGHATLGVAPSAEGTVTYRAISTGYQGAPAVSTSTSQAAITSGVAEPSIVIGSLAPAVTGENYNLTLDVVGGTGPFTWTASGLPEGMSLSSDGTLTGTPTTPGTYDITLSLTDSRGKSAQTSTQIVVRPVVGIESDSLPEGIAGQDYTATLVGTGGTTPYHWTADGLPAGLTISDDGVISGATATEGTSQVTVTITDTNGKTATKEFTLATNAALALTTTSLPAGTVGADYSATLAATGGASPYTWSQTGLPDGLSLNTTTGAITGTPTQAGTFDAVTITVTDDNDYTASATFSVEIAAAFAITTATLPNGVVGTAYAEATLATIAGTAPLTWSQTGLPAGLSLDASTGVISGTPTEAGTFDAVTISVTDANSKSAQADFTLTVAPAVHITTTTLPDGVVGTEYPETSLAAADGNGSSYFWAAANLPDGLVLNGNTGVISGVPTVAGQTDNVVVTVTDEAGKTAEATLSITIGAAVRITTTSLPDGVAGTGYTQTTLEAADGNGGPYTWSSTTLPDGLSLSAAGVITGTPTSAGVYDSVKITVTDAQGATAEATFSVTIAQAVHITTASLPAGIVGTVYPETTLAAADGDSASYTWASTTLPAGLELSASGVLTGTPTTDGTFDAVKITVTDADGKTAEATFTITIAKAVHITTASLPAGVVGTDYSETTLAAADGNSATYTWASTTLPAGLSLSETGVLTGTPTTDGTFDAVKITVTDADGKTTEATFTITIAKAVHITTASLPGGVVGTSYTATVEAADGAPTYTWGSTTLPTGLSINTNTGEITGTPTDAGTFDAVKIIATDADGKTAEATFSITVAPAVHITTATLPAGVVGTDYPETTLAAADGNSVSYSWASTTLPAGLSLSSDGKITGTPTTDGTFDAVTITVTDHAGKTAEATFSITIAKAVHITTISLPDGVRDEAYPATTVTALDGAAPYTWSATGLPTGLALDPDTGSLSGTPTIAGTSDTVTITVTDHDGKTAEATFSITIHPVMAVTTATLAEGVMDEAYTATLSGLGGIAPREWALTGLPAGLSLNTATGEITGSPAESGTFDLVATLTDADDRTATRDLSLMIRPVVHITTASLPAGVVGTDYSTSLAAAGGTTAYAWTSTTLPAGLNLTSAGVLSGTPTASGSTTVTLTVTDDHLKTASVELSIAIAPAVHITTASLPAGVVGTTYADTQLTAADGNSASYTWTSTTLPAGLEFSTGGLLTGTPTSDGVTTVTFTVTDHQGKTATAELSITIAKAVHITTTSLPAGVVGSDYPETTLAAADGDSATYTWASTTLPAGLSLSEAGVLTGTPTTDGTFDAVKITVTDADGKTAEATFTITIAKAVHITTTSLPSVEAGDAYPETTLTAADGNSASYTWASTTLPAGLTLSEAGALTGTPTEAGTTAVTFTVTDAGGKAATADLSITITAAAHLTNTALSIGVIGGDYSTTLTADGGTAPYTYAATTLPDGLTLTDGVISGTPTAAGTNTSIDLTVTDAHNKTATTTLGLTVVKPKTEAAGANHSCAITPSGGVECWGSNTVGQLGDNTTTNRTYPVRVSGLSGPAISVSAGGGQTCAVLKNGQIQCWGANTIGQLGVGDNVAHPVPVTVAGISSAVTVAAGTNFTCAAFASGTAACWGQGASGQLGNGSSTNVYGPASVKNLTNVMDVQASGYHACALTTAGSVSCWGRNNARQIGAGGAAGTSSYNTPVAVPDVSGVTSLGTHLSNHTCVTESSGAVRCWGSNGSNQLGATSPVTSGDALTVPGITDAVQAFTGNNHSCAVTSTGVINCWGDSYYGQLGDGTSGSRTANPVFVSNISSAVTSASVGSNHSCARTAAGAVVCWGSNQGGQLANGLSGNPVTPLAVPTLTQVSQVSGGSNATCAVVNGGAKCWGANTYGQLGNNSTVSSPTPVDVSGLTAGVTQVGVGQDFACALTSGGAVQCWGKNTSGQLGNDVAGDSTTPVSVQGLGSAVTKITVGYQHACALTTAGAVKCWGYNASHELGDNSSTNRPAPVNVSGLSSGVIDVAAGQAQTCAVLSGGTLECWGNNGNGELGLGVAGGTMATPTVVTGVSGPIASVSAGQGFTCALTSSGTAQCWGNNSLGELGDGTTTNHAGPADVSGVTGATAISAGLLHMCVLDSGSGVRCWGFNSSGQLGDGTSTNRTLPTTVSGLTDIRAVSSGYSHTCALTNSGTLACWGSNTLGELGQLTSFNPTPTAVIGFNVAPLAAGTANPPAGVVGTTYTSGQLTATGGAAPYTWTATGLPAGLSINADGSLTGTPTADGTSEVTFTVTDARRLTATTTASITIAKAVHITTDTSLPGGVLGTAYSTQLAAADGTGPYTWSSDLVPAGLTLSQDGVLSGTPTAVTASTTMQITATDANGKTDTQAFTIVITPVIQGVAVLSGGPWTGCVITGSGGAECWGRNDVGQLGNGTTTVSAIPVQVSGLTSGVQQIVSGASHSCALTEAGGVKCWGTNALGQLGNGTGSDSATPVDVPGLTSGVTSIATSTNHTCAITAAGALKCWGYNSAGQLGDGTLTTRSTPIQVPGFTSGVTQVVASSGSTCVLVEGGVSCWGSNIKGQLGDGSLDSTSTPVAVSGLSSGVSALSIYGKTACALTTAGAVKCWGYNASGQLGNESTDDSSVPVNVSGLDSGVKQISAGVNHVCALTDAGGTKCWGDNTYGELGNDSTTGATTPVDVQGLTSGVTSIEARNNSTCALTTTGYVKCWGTNTYGQLGNGTTDTSLVPVDVFGYGPVALRVATSGLRVGEVGISYPETAVHGAGGTAPYTWAATGLPNGLSINSSTGVISGTPTEAGTFNAVKITLTDSTDATVETTLSLTTIAGVRVTTSSLPDGVVNASYTATTLAAADGTAPYVWSATGLPAGLSLNASTGEITGTPTAYGVFSVAITATDQNKYTATTTIPLSVLAIAGADSDLISIDGGANHTCAVNNVGGVECWGLNNAGQLGNGTLTTSFAPVEVTGLSSGVTAVASGTNFTCALTNAGGVKCWGFNTNGQLGNGTTTPHTTPVDVSGLSSGVTAISAGSGAACALTSTGGVKCWGLNANGQLGNGTTTQATNPVDVDGLTSGVTAISAGLRHNCAVTATGGAKCWGYNSNGALGDDTTTDRYTPVDVTGLTSGVTTISAGNFHTCALTNAGGLKCWGYNLYGQLGNGNTTDSHTPVDVTGLTSGVTAASLGAAFSCAITSGGGTTCWGSNLSGQLGIGTTTNSSTAVAVAGLASGVTAIAAGGGHACALTSGHDVACWGTNTYGQVGNGQSSLATVPVAATGLAAGVVTTGAGYSHTCALTADGGVTCWGNNASGQLGDGTTTTRSTAAVVTGLASGMTAVASGSTHTCALTTSGGVTCWGSNGNGQLGNGTTTDSHTPVDVTGLASGVTAITAGGTHTCALTNSGGIKCWGNNFAGAVGNGTTNDAYTPVDVNGLTSGVAAITAGGSHTCALTNSGGIKCWGYNETGELGNGTTTASTTPVDVDGLTSGATAVEAGGSQTCAITTDGGAKCWGYNSSGQLGNGTQVNASSPVDVSGLATGVASINVGSYHACAVTSTGGIKCWGQGSYGQLGHGSTTSSSVPIDVAGMTSGMAGVSGGNQHTCAVSSAGAVSCWGTNASGQLGNSAIVTLVPGAVLGHAFTPTT